ncbi:hypothetical protein ACH3XW_28385 [Acanthocheilonema viteae]
MSSTIWNPCLYTLMNDEFRLAFLSLLQPFWIVPKEKFDIRYRCRMYAINVNCTYRECSGGDVAIYSGSQTNLISSQNCDKSLDDVIEFQKIHCSLLHLIENY